MEHISSPSPPTIKYDTIADGDGCCRVFLIDRLWSWELLRHAIVSLRTFPRIFPPLRSAWTIVRFNWPSMRPSSPERICDKNTDNGHWFCSFPFSPPVDRHCATSRRPLAPIYYHNNFKVSLFFARYRSQGGSSNRSRFPLSHPVSRRPAMAPRVGAMLCVSLCVSCGDKAASQKTRECLPDSELPAGLMDGGTTP